MADDVTFQPTVATPPSGTKVATDEVGGSHFQRVKLDLGGDGVSTPVEGTVPVSGTVTVNEPVTVDGTVQIDDSTPIDVAVISGGGGGTQYTEADTDASITGTAMLWEDAADTLRAVSAAKPLPIGDAGGSLTVDGTVTAAQATAANLNATVVGTGTFAVQDSAAEASLSVLDDWDESDRAKVNPIAGQAGVQGASGTVTALTQRVVLATDVALPAGTNNIGDVDVLTVPSPLSTAGNGTAATAHRVTIASDSTGQVAVASIAAGTNNIGDVDVLTVPAPLSTTGNGTAATALRVALASDSTGIVKETRAATGTTTSVASSATNVTLLASNANRLGATIFNDSTQNLFVKFGATASSSSFAVKMTPGTYYEVPFNYTGIIDGIWASANGNARITELT